ncbi:hypothetical protein BJ508DRAFT_66968 [Ascobolus immersus RN42]|uniref:Uncharacterized protein n=1 Tax=Ascobolus immersus RN42 TaxID=1160509 RepID=A0A3N4IBR1_ASCIM|nr:hypothetical protein BJ508DRAFT_66968 [Ascobolus immersus RN42]
MLRDLMRSADCQFELRHEPTNEITTPMTSLQGNPLSRHHRPTTAPPQFTKTLSSSSTRLVFPGLLQIRSPNSPILDSAPAKTSSTLFRPVSLSPPRNTIPQEVKTLESPELLVSRHETT